MYNTTLANHLRSHSEQYALYSLALKNKRAKKEKEVADLFRLFGYRP